VSKKPSEFRETNVKRLCRAVRAAGNEISCVEFDKATGNIRVYPGKPAEPANTADTANPWNEAS
jgi:hypothetical protein